MLKRQPLRFYSRTPALPTPRSSMRDGPVLRYVQPRRSPRRPRGRDIYYRIHDQAPGHLAPPSSDTQGDPPRTRVPATPRDPRDDGTFTNLKEHPPFTLPLLETS